ncbi:TraR/DksA family transcriptional regulator [Catenuloplanes sp. NPDC051500]|uniref:TraR/DksA family transcriptional regulator n=1 Tax=Catenuloplanes sp. NPDC051500 TaxID=3363959 RepID=UPI00378A5A2E
MRSAARAAGTGPPSRSDSCRGGRRRCPPRPACRHASGHRIRNTYGGCQRCRVPIPVARLAVLPHARFCVPCQQKHVG